MQEMGTTSSVFMRHMPLLLLMLLLHCGFIGAGSTATTAAPPPTPPPQLPGGCPQLNTSTAGNGTMPGTLPADEGYLDFISGEGGSRKVLYYSVVDGIASELLWSAGGVSATYQLYDHTHGQVVSSIADWPTGACNSRNASGGVGLGPYLTELRSSALTNGSSPCLLALLAPDLAAVHGHSSNSSLSGLAWSENGTACFYDNQTAGAGKVWRVHVTLAGQTTEVSGVQLELMSPVTDNSTGVVTTTSWIVGERRTIHFLARQRRPPREAILAVANTPAFAACGAARESSASPPPPQQLGGDGGGNLRVRSFSSSAAASTEAGVDSVSRVSVTTLLPEPGSRLHAAHGPGWLRLLDDHASGMRFALSLANGNCSVDAPSDPPPATSGPLPFNLSATGWLFTGVVSFNGLPCQRFLLPAASAAAAPSYEVYFRRCHGNESSSNFTTLAGYRERRVGNASDVSVLVTDVASLADLPYQYDLAACSGSDSRRLLLRLRATFDELAATSRVKLVNNLSAAVATVTGVSPLRIAEVSVARDADAQQSQVWFTLLGPPRGAKSPQRSLADALKSLGSAVTGGHFTVLNWHVAKLDEAATATDASGGGGGVVIHDGHSGGAMAGLAFFMLLLGSGFGVLGAWCVWKRRPNMPYYVQD